MERYRGPDAAAALVAPVEGGGGRDVEDGGDEHQRLRQGELPDVVEREGRDADRPGQGAAAAAQRAVYEAAEEHLLHYRPEEDGDGHELIEALRDHGLYGLVVRRAQALGQQEVYDRAEHQAQRELQRVGPEDRDEEGPGRVERPVEARAQEAPAEEKPAAPAPAGTQGAVSVDAPMPGTILDVKTSVGASVNAGDVLVILEAMKMENEIVAPQAGTIASVNVSKGDSVEAGQVIITMN